VIYISTVYSMFYVCFSLTVTTFVETLLRTKNIWIRHIFRILQTQLIWSSQQLPAQNIRSSLFGTAKQVIRGIQEQQMSLTDLCLASCKCH